MYYIIDYMYTIVHRSRVYLLKIKKGRNYLVKSKVRKCNFSTNKKFEVKNIQITKVTKVDQMIVFYNGMWSIIAHSCIRPFFVR